MGFLVYKVGGGAGFSHCIWFTSVSIIPSNIPYTYFTHLLLTLYNLLLYKILILL